MSRAVRIALLVPLALLALPACEDGDVGTGTDASDDATASGDGDGSSGTEDGTDSSGDGDGDGNALVLEFESSPEVGDDEEAEGAGEFRAVFEVATFTLRDVRVIGDASILEARAAVLDWTESDVEFLRFAPVVPGLYSRIRGEVTKIDLRGTIELERGEVEFEIKADGNMLAEFSTDVAVTVGPNEEVALTLTADLTGLVDSVDWGDVCEDDECEVEKNDPALEPVLEHMRRVFVAGDDNDDEDDEGDGGGGDRDGESSGRELR